VGRGRAHATDAEETPSGYADLVSVCRAARVPVLARDWQLHPLQARAGSLHPSGCAAAGANARTRAPTDRPWRARLCQSFAHAASGSPRHALPCPAAPGACGRTCGAGRGAGRGAGALSGAGARAGGGGQGGGRGRRAGHRRERVGARRARLQQLRGRARPGQPGRGAPPAAAHPLAAAGRGRPARRQWVQARSGRVAVPQCFMSRRPAVPAHVAQLPRRESRARRRRRS